MAKSVTSGEMRTRIRVCAVTKSVVAGHEIPVPINVFADTSHTTMPTPSLTLLGQIIEYKGVTTETPPIYTQYKLYECVSDSGETPTYSWELLTPVRCKWVNAHGSDAFENHRQELGQMATITMHYSSLITPMCILWREEETGTTEFPLMNSWEIISIDDVEDRHIFLEIVVKRKVVA